MQGIWREPREAIRRWLSTHRALKLLESELDDANSRLDHQAQSFESQLADFGLTRLSRRDAFRFFRHLVNYDASVLAATTPSAPEAYLDYFVADSPVDCHRDHLLVGSQQVKVLSMKEPPSQTFAHILGDLLEVPGEFIACLEWQRNGTGQLRLSGRKKELPAIDALEADVIDPSNEQSTAAVLDKVSGSVLIGARQRQARIQLLVGMLEQLLVDSKRVRDTDTAALTMQMTTWRDGRAAAEAFVARSGDALRTWRQP